MNCCGRKNLPIVKKCCFCVPLRKGVIIFGYVNLIISLLSVPLLLFMLVEEATSFKPAEDREEIRGDPLIHALTLAFVTVDVAMTIVLLVGAHKKKKILLQIYFFSGLILQILPLFVDFVYLEYNSHLEKFFYFVCFGLNIYLLFLVYNAIYLIEESRQVQYISHQNQLIEFA